MKTRILSLMLAVAVLVGAIGIAPFSLATFAAPTFNFNFMNNGSAYSSHAGFRVIPLPDCGGWRSTTSPPTSSPTMWRRT